MEFKASIFAIVIASMVLVAIGILVNAWSNEYNANLANDLGVYNKMNDTENYITTATGNINPQSGEASSDTESITFRGSYAFITGIPAIMRIGYSMIYTIADYWNVPAYIIQAIIIMIGAAIVTTIVAIIFRLNRISA